MMRRRKSSCPDIDHRRASLASNSQKNGVKLDLYIEDDELLTNRHRSPSPTTKSDHRRASANIEDVAEEVLCLRLLSTKTRYRFGGLRVHIISPVFNVDKLFNVEFDQESQVSLIKSQHSNLEQNNHSESLSSLDRAKGNAKTATIVISPDTEDVKLDENLSSLSADLTLYEEAPNHRLANKKPVYVSANSLHSRSSALGEYSSSPPPPQPPSGPLPEKRRQPSTASIDKSENVKFSNAKVYANLNRSSLIESINLETSKQLPNNNNNNNNSRKFSKSKTATQRRHTHYYCYIPSSVTAAAAAAEAAESSSDEQNSRRGSSHSIRRYMAKKVSDTYHSAARMKKFFSDSISIFKR